MDKQSDPNNRPSPKLDAALVRAMTDPFLARLLYSASDKADGVTIRQLADRLREPHRKVRYHVQVLTEQGLLVIAGERQRRGMIERYYRAERTPVLDEDELQFLTLEQKRSISLQILKFILADASAAVAGETLWRPGNTEVRLSGEVDPTGWADLARLHRRAMGEVEAILAESRLRLHMDRENAIAVTSALLLFEVPTWPS